MESMMDGFFKVEETGGTFVVATFFNPETKEETSCCVRDYDYGDCSRDREDLYQLPINKEVRRLWQHHNGVILPGDTVRVVKGRKVKIGTVAVVKEIRDIYDCYRRPVATYAYFENGQRTNITNCVLEGV